jgi:hypothetical protein
MCLQLVSNATIFVITISTILCMTLWQKVICNHIFDYKMVLSYKWDYDLCLMLGWMKT